MDDVPQTAEDYDPEDLQQVKAGCLEVATRLGELLDDLVIVGGLVPALLVDLAQEETLDETDPLSKHVGTRDLDLGFAIGLVDEGRYTEISTRTAVSLPGDPEERNNVLKTYRWRLTRLQVQPDGDDETSLRRIEGCPLSIEWLSRSCRESHNKVPSSLWIR